jgi:hypothetical protein
MVLNSRGYFFLLGVGLAQLLVGCCRFLFARWQGESFVELARLLINYLFRVGLPRLFDKILLSESSSVGLSQFSIWAVATGKMF